MNDQESQEDELLALASIYEDDAIYSAVTLGDGEPGDPGGQFSASPDLSHAQPFYVTFNAGVNFGISCIVIFHALSLSKF